MVVYLIFLSFCCEIIQLLVMIFILIGCIFFIFLDELIMGCSQRRIGPINLGWYGILTSIINGCNLIISQFLIPKINIYFGFQVFPVFFFLFYFYNYIILYPFFLILINFGPQHPSTHGVLRLICILYGEIIQWIIPEIGLLHRGTEKLIDLHYYNSSISYFDRFDYVSTITQELLFIHTLERFMSWYISIYDSTLRTLFIEFYRILNHSLAITTHAIDIGLFTSMLWSFEEREKLINFSEVLSGNRFHAAFLLMGRLRYDISLRWIESFIYWLSYFTMI